MTSIYDLFETDEDKETEGFVHRITDKISFTLARAGGANKRFQKVMEAKTRPYRRQIQDDSMDVDLANELMRETFAETVILGWEGITDKDGKPIKFSPANALKLLNQMPDLFDELRDAASKQANFRAEQIADDVGN